MKYPRISLVTGCYNHEKYIAQTIESVISQGYPNLQYVVINDASTDNSEKIIKKYAKYLYHWKTLPGYRKTITSALNKGFSYTNGGIMGWLNSKNILLPKSLFTIAEIFSQLKKVDWITGIATAIDGQSKIVRIRFNKKSVYDYLIGNWPVIQQESTFWRRGLWNETGGKLKNIPLVFDMELWTRFFLKTNHYHVNTVLGSYRKIPSALSVKNKDKLRQYADKLIKKMQKKISQKMFLKAKIYYVMDKYLWPALGLIPHKIYQKFPCLSEYSYKIIFYSFKDNQWKIKEQNPFRKKFL